MKHGVLLVGTAFATFGAVLLAAGYGAAGVLACLLALACVAVAFSVRWRLEDVDQPGGPLRRTDGLPPGRDPSA